VSFSVTDTGDGSDAAPKTSDTATVSVTVTAVNDAPAAANGTATTAEDTATTIDLAALVSDAETSDADLTYNASAVGGTLATTATNGVYTSTPFPYTPLFRSVSFSVTDTGDGSDAAPKTSDTATVSITVT